MQGSDYLLFGAIAIMIVFMFTSNRKRKRQAQELQDSIKVGSSVMLNSGIYGTVLAIDEARATIESGPGTTFVVNRMAIRQVETAPVSALVKPKAAAKPVAKKATAAKAPAKKAPAKKTSLKK